MKRRRGTEEDEENNQNRFRIHKSIYSNFELYHFPIVITVRVNSESNALFFIFQEMSCGYHCACTILNQASRCRVDDLLSINVISSLVSRQSEGSDKINLIAKGEPISSRRQQSQCSFG